MKLQQSLVFATLIGLMPALATAGDYPPSPEEGVLHLDPEAGYAVPLTDEMFLPLEFDPGELPVRLVAVSYDRSQTSIQATLRATGTQPIGAWAVELSTFGSDGTLLGSTTLTEDWAVGGSPSPVSLEEKKATTTLNHEDGLFYPGQVHVAAKLGLAHPREPDAPSPARLVLSIPMVVFADTSFGGAQVLARRVLADRKAAAEELAYWSVRLAEVLEHDASGQENIAELEEVRAQLEEASPHFSHPAQAVRGNLVGNLDAIIFQAERHPGSERSELMKLMEWIEVDLEARLRQVPKALPVAPGGPSADNEIRQRAFEDPNFEPSCDCGGSIFTSSSQSESRNCNGSGTGWRVNESWSYSCRDEDGSALTSGSGPLNGVGGCIEGRSCFADTYCAPHFSPASQSEDLDFHYWSRSVVNQTLFVGICTTRCSVSSSQNLSFKCACSPKPVPRCRTDGCPILIETGVGGYRLTDLADGVRFDLDSDGTAERASWTVEGTDDAWLVLDRNGNGVIDDGRELFGDSTSQPPSAEPNGFLALAVFDQPEEGGDGDGQVTASDRVFSELRLWLDRDHDGISDPAELTTLAEEGIVALELDYHESRRRDRHGNEFRYAAQIWLASGARRLAQDVYLLYE